MFQRQIEREFSNPSFDKDQSPNTVLSTKMEELEVGREYEETERKSRNPMSSPHAPFFN